MKIPNSQCTCNNGILNSHAIDVADMYCNDCDWDAQCEHEYDWEEGYTCLNCGEQGDVGELIDALDYMEDR